MLITIGTRQVDVLDTRCPNRSCYIFGFDKGTFVQGRGYTNYWSTPKPVCWRRHLSGCPVAGVCSVCRTAAVEGIRTCERPNGPDPFHPTPCGGEIMPAGSPRPIRVIRGYRHGRLSGGCLVTIDETELPLPVLGPYERRYSPDGFQWGYAGPGPAELARAILAALYPQDLVARRAGCYQAFKTEIIARLMEDEFTLTSLEVDAWYQRWQQTGRGRQVADEADTVRRLKEAP